MKQIDTDSVYNALIAAGKAALTKDKLVVGATRLLKKAGQKEDEIKGNLTTIIKTYCRTTGNKAKPYSSKALEKALFNAGLWPTWETKKGLRKPVNIKKLMESGNEEHEALGRAVNTLRSLVCQMNKKAKAEYEKDQKKVILKKADDKTSDDKTTDDTQADDKADVKVDDKVDDKTTDDTQADDKTTDDTQADVKADDKTSDDKADVKTTDDTQADEFITVNKALEIIESMSEQAQMELFYQLYKKADTRLSLIKAFNEYKNTL